MDSLSLPEIEGIIEALLFAHGEPLPLQKICDILEIDKKTVKSLINNMNIKYEKNDRGIMIRDINEKYQLCTKFQYYPYVKKLFDYKQAPSLSQAAFETLAIIAYNQPVTKAKIEKIRGVNCESAISKLLERNLVREAGRLDAPGKPVLYETTEQFLKSFGFSSIKDLPVLDMDI